MEAGDELYRRVCRQSQRSCVEGSPPGPGALAHEPAVAQLCGVENDCSAYRKPAASVVYTPVGDTESGAPVVESQASAHCVVVQSSDFLLASATAVTAVLHLEDGNATTDARSASKFRDAGHLSTSFIDSAGAYVEL